MGKTIVSETRVGKCDDRRLRFVSQNVIEGLGRPFVCETKSEVATDEVYVSCRHRFGLFVGAPVVRYA